MNINKKKSGTSQTGPIEPEFVDYVLGDVGLYRLLDVPFGSLQQVVKLCRVEFLSEINRELFLNA